MAGPTYIFGDFTLNRRSLKIVKPQPYIAENFLFAKDCFVYQFSDMANHFQLKLDANYIMLAHTQKINGVDLIKSQIWQMDHEGAFIAQKEIITSDKTYEARSFDRRQIVRAITQAPLPFFEDMQQKMDCKKLAKLGFCEHTMICGTGNIPAQAALTPNQEKFVQNMHEIKTGSLPQLLKMYGQGHLDALTDVSRLHDQMRYRTRYTF